MNTPTLNSCLAIAVGHATSDSIVSMSVIDVESARPKSMKSNFVRDLGVEHAAQ